MGTMSKNRAEEILGLSGTYDAKKLRDEYRKLAAKNHPDAVASRGGDVAAADAKMKDCLLYTSSRRSVSSSS